MTRGWAIVILLSVPAASAGPRVLAQEERMIILEHADSLVVRNRQGNVRIASARAIQYPARGIVHLDGDVVMQDDSVTIEAPRGVYYQDVRRAEALDSVRLNDGHSVLTAGYGEYFMASQIALMTS